VVGDVGRATRRSYQSHVRIYLVPQIGDIPLQRLSRGDLRRMFADLAVSGVRKPLSAATLRLLRLSRVERTLEPITYVGQRNADSPVTAWPMTSWCTSEVRS